ncbi:hypothetical protein D3C79_533570 [compost metagenome]
MGGQAGDSVLIDKQAIAFGVAGPLGVMQHVARHPKRALRRHQPQAVFRLAADHAAHRINQLRLAVPVRGHLPIAADGGALYGKNRPRYLIDIETRFGDNWHENYSHFGVFEKHYVLIVQCGLAR